MRTILALVISVFFQLKLFAGRSSNSLEHWWLFQADRPVSIPLITDDSWSTSPVDRFILHRLCQSNLTPSSEAAKEVLIRRLTYSLTGLAPTLAENEAYLKDTCSKCDLV